MPRVLSIGLACLLVAGAAGARPLPETTVALAGARYTVEIADDDHSRMRGLMFRESMPADRGMLFVFEREQALAFWMKNTRMALDILYFDAQLRLVSMVTPALPCRTAYCPAYPSEAPARFVLELNAGEAARLGLQPGTTMEVMPIGSATTTLD